MTLSRLLTIFIIFCFVTTAWFFLGFNITQRTHSGYKKIGKEVQQLWGSPHIQKAPKVNFIMADIAVNSELESSNINLGINLKHRRKGLCGIQPMMLILKADIHLSIHTMSLSRHG